MNHFTEALGLSRYTLYMQDYGGPVGFSHGVVHPDRIVALIVQDAVAHNEDLGRSDPRWDRFRRGACRVVSNDRDWCESAAFVGGAMAQNATVFQSRQTFIVRHCV